MNTTNKVEPRSHFIAILIGLALFAAACTQQGLTGAMEEEELYNTNGLQGQPLFAPDGLAPVAVATKPFVRVGLMWDAPDATRLAGRVQLDDGSWGDFQAIQPRFSEDGFHTGHVDVDSRARAFQLRLEAGPAPSFLLVEGIERVGEPLGATPAQPDDRYAAVRQALAPASLVHTRSDWGARSPKCNSGSHSPAKITIHHTASPLPDTVSVITRLRGIQNYHMDTRGWCDIGYHYLVDWNGEIWQGRPETTIGAHVLNNNTSNVGISFIGTYNAVDPTAAQINKAADLVDWLAGTYGIAKDRNHLKGHREYRGNDPGDCPGDRIQSRLGDLLSGGYVDDGGGGDDGGGDVGAGNGTIQGVVFVDQGSGTNDMSWRLPGASVTTGAGSTSARADDAYWSLSVPGGTHTLTASAAGYRTASRTCSVSADQSVWCSIGLVPDDGTAPGGDDGGDVGGDDGGDAGGDDGSGDVGGDDGGGDAGGDDGGGGAGDVGGDYGDNADDPPGRLFGFVVRADSEDFDLETCSGEVVPGAWVGAETQEFTYADGSGYFDFEVIAGDHLVGAKADGFLDGAANCAVESGGETFCCVPLIPDPGAHPDEEDMTEVQVGCATGGAASGTGWLALLALAALLVCPRRRRPGRSA